MAAELLLQPQLTPSFDLPEKYAKDIWDIMNWDIYKNATEASKDYYKSRTSIFKYCLDFSGCTNPCIKEEFKYCFYYLIESYNTGLAGLADWIEGYKNVCKYANESTPTSLLDISEEEYVAYFTKTHKATEKNGTQVSCGEEKAAHRKNRQIRFFLRCQKILKEYLEKDIPLFEKNCWTPAELPQCQETYFRKKPLDFTDIKDSFLLRTVKDYCWFKLNTLDVGTVYNHLSAIKVFIKWYGKTYPKAITLTNVDRDDMEDFYVYLRTQTSFSKTKRNLIILNIKMFFQWGLMTYRKDMPHKSVIFDTDWSLKVNKESKFFNDEEMTGLLSLIPKLPPIAGRMLFILTLTGMRIGELCTLDKNCIRKTSNGGYELLIKEYKTKTDHSIAISEAVVSVINKQLEENKEQYGDDFKFVFNSKNKAGYNPSSLHRQVRTAILKNDIKGRDGELLRFSPHRLRATKAVKMLSNGENPELVSKILGHNCVRSLSYYASIDEKVTKDALKEYLDAVDGMIQNIGNTEKLKESIPEKAIPLCNGFCNKPIELGLCKKANACLSCPLFIPSIQFINTYELELRNVNAAIDIAKVSNMEKLLKTNLETKAKLEEIISKLKEARDGKKEK